MKRIRLSPPQIDGPLALPASESGLGEIRREFESKLEDHLQTSKVAVVSSGTAAIHLGLKLLGVAAGDIVICQSLTFVASANPILELGALPVFVDSEQDSWNMDPNALEDAVRYFIEKGKSIKAIVPVHLYGMPAKMNDIKSIADKYEIPILEDAAEALGSTSEGVLCGNFGDLGVLSFNENKIITTSGGGALLSRSDEVVERARYLATQARQPAPHYEHKEAGYNYQMGGVNAALGLDQLDSLEQNIQKRRDVFSHYQTRLSNELKNNPCISFQPEIEGSFSNRWLSTILTPKFELREEIRGALNDVNVESRPIWKPMHLQPLYVDAPYFGSDVAERLFQKGLCLPSGVGLTDDNLSLISETIIQTIEASSHHE